ncbi:MAG: hypothetical protein HPY85_09825 [Anaerolineae bacterium]|nr:hypothetical protein [Anaerolineae bacterium]
MKKLPLYWGIAIIGLMVFSACGNGLDLFGSSKPGDENAPQSESGAMDDLVPDQIHPSTYLTSAITERPSHVHYPNGMAIDYLYRSFLQIPSDMVWGRDGKLYIADWAGRHVVTVDKDGTMADLGLWKTVRPFQELGPRHLEMDSTGNLYIATHSMIFRLSPAGDLAPLTGIDEYPINSLAISPEDELYYTIKNDGKIYRWQEGQFPILITSEISEIGDIEFGLDGTLYMTQTGKTTIKKIDLDTGDVLPFAVDVCDHDPCWLTVDTDGDIWARSNNELHQLSPDGVEKPFTVDGVIVPGGFFWSHTPGGIAFDDEGALWMGCYNSRLIRLVAVPGKVDEFSTEFFAGFEASDLAVDSNGNIVAPDINRGEVWKITPDGERVLVTTLRNTGRITVAFDADDHLFIGTGNGEILRVESDGTTSHYANVVTQRMVFGADGVLYAVSGYDNQLKSIVAVTGMDTVASLISEVDGVSFGTGGVHIAPALDTGLFVFAEEGRNLFHVDFDGNGSLVAHLNQFGAGGPVAMTSSPLYEEVYLIPHGSYDLIGVGMDGSVKELVYDFWGDPWGMVSSPDGKWLYVAESGAIDKLSMNIIRP